MFTAGSHPMKRLKTRDRAFTKKDKALIHAGGVNRFKLYMDIRIALPIVNRNTSLHNLKKMRKCLLETKGSIVVAIPCCICSARVVDGKQLMIGTIYQISVSENRADDMITTRHGQKRSELSDRPKCLEIV
ncbi:unnamed protein product [Porites lobata]|uniref:Uncharacterized protein n=1 Tax=Porites lobata TaxID=104759 RepID=A0ABN8NZB6_9CNID|nr:unnamed protein product [Porites lobata]